LKNPKQQPHNHFATKIFGNPSMDPTTSFPDSPFIGPIDSQIPLKRKVAQLSKQFSSLKINNSNQQIGLDLLFDELKQIKSSFNNLANDIKDINSMKTLYSDFVQLKLNFQNEAN
jgi:hypothetical protein